MTRKKIAILIVLLLIADQIVKLLVKTSMFEGESIRLLGDWLQLRYVENPGAAFGMQLGGSYGKLILSLFRIVAVGVIGWYIGRLVKRNAPAGVIVGFSLIFAGAVGNIIDSVFYGVIFGEAPLLYGHVVDMIYLHLFRWESVPRWLSFLVDGEGYFFGPVFNLADSYISVAVVYLALFQHKVFKEL